jgi:hypothetical protein
MYYDLYIYTLFCSHAFSDEARQLETNKKGATIQEGSTNVIFDGTILIQIFWYMRIVKWAQHREAQQLEGRAAMIVNIR